MTWTNEIEFEGGEGREIVSGDRLIATVYNPTDADLIAAAPDLLAALDYTVGKLIAFADAETDDEEMWILDDIKRVCRAAITKAKGN